MDAINIKRVLEQAKSECYDQIILCLTDCEEIILQKGDRVNFDLYTDFLQIKQSYDDGFMEWDITNYINADHVSCIRVETKKDNIKLKDDDLDDYHKDLEEEYERLVEKKDNPCIGNIKTITISSGPLMYDALRGLN